MQVALLTVEFKEDEGKTSGRLATATISSEILEETGEWGVTEERQYPAVGFEPAPSHIQWVQYPTVCFEPDDLRLIPRNTVSLANPVSEISMRIRQIGPEMQRRIEGDIVFSFRMLSAIAAIEKILTVAALPFEISELRLGSDPEVPTWKPIEVKVRVRVDDYGVVLRVWDEVSNAVNSIRNSEDIHIILDN